MRRTESILLDLISQWRNELLVVSFAAGKVPEVLIDAASRFPGPRNSAALPPGPAGRFHAKAVIADAQRALVTSANLTGNALEVNMELGLLVQGGLVPGRLAAHFAELIAREILREVP